MSILYVGALFSSYTPLTFGIHSYKAVFFCGFYCILVFHKKLPYSILKTTMKASVISTLIFVPSCDKLNSYCHFLNNLKSEIYYRGLICTSIVPFGYHILTLLHITARLRLNAYSGLLCVRS